jgi:hypothetical protein
MLARPVLSYEQSLYGVLGIVGIVGVCLTLALVERAVRERGGAPSAPIWPSFSLDGLAGNGTPSLRAVRLSVIAFAALTALTFGGYYIRRDADRWEGGGSSGVLMEHVGG